MGWQKALGGTHNLLVHAPGFVRVAELRSAELLLGGGEACE